MSGPNDLQATLEALRAERTSELASLSEAGERWLEAKAARKPTDSVEAEISAIERNTRRLEQKIHRQEKRLRR